MNLRHLTTAILFAGIAAVLFGTVRTASAAPVMVVTCSGPTGLNIASDTERDRPKDSVPEVYDPEAKAYVSHPRKTYSVIITVNSDGTASQTSFKDDGTTSPLVIGMNIVGTINNDAITLIDGKNGYVDLLTLYPKESIAVSVGTSYTGWNKAIPVGYAYISHCKFSHVIN
jgi:hypothetical protein